jgi:membrane peptidoglycan carboxypeptidase
MGIGRPAAGKTGTVDNYSAAWFAGYTPELAAAVWVGDPRGGYKYPMGNLCMDGVCYGAVFGATIPAPIWRDSMIGALAGREAGSFYRPPSRYFRRGSGEDLVTLPDVRGMRLSAAIARLRAAGFRVDVGGRVESEYPEGTVADMSPGPGASVEPGTYVTLRPSSGEPEEEEPEDPFPGLPPFPSTPPLPD